MEDGTRGGRESERSRLSTDVGGIDQGGSDRVLMKDRKGFDSVLVRSPGPSSGHTSFSVTPTKFCRQREPNFLFLDLCPPTRVPGMSGKRNLLEVRQGNLGPYDPSSPLGRSPTRVDSGRRSFY